jgi:hypothetical protein
VEFYCIYKHGESAELVVVVSLNARVRSNQTLKYLDFITGVVEWMRKFEFQS